MTAPQILVVDDEADIRTLIEEILSEEGYSVQTAGDAAEARSQVDRQRPDLVLLDIWMPDVDGITLLKEWSQSGDIDCPVVIMSGHGTVETAVEATRLGAVDFVEKPLSLAKLLRTVGNALEDKRTPAPARGRSIFPPMSAPVGKSQAMRELRERAKEIAGHTASVLIIGESGTGREAFAYFMHSLGSRSQGPFVNVVSASISDDNASALLLGAGSGNGDVAGYFADAAGGTLFINDLEDLCPEAQRLLRGVLEQGEFTGAGQAPATRTDFRVVTSVRPGTIENPAEHGVRADLLGHLAVLRLNVPPLRDYPEDVSDLLRHFVDLMVENDRLMFRRFSVAAQNRLRNYPWPGNIRELRNLVHRLLIAGGKEEIDLAELEGELAPPDESVEPLVKQDLLALPLREAREQFERAYLTQQLMLCGGKVGQLAKRVGMERTHLYRKLRSLGVDFRQTGGEES